MAKIGYTVTDTEVHIHYNKSDVFNYCASNPTALVWFAITVLVAMLLESFPLTLFCGAMFIFRCFELYYIHRMAKLICSVQKVAPHIMKRAIEAFEEEN
jgi:hypothetical protein